MSKKLGYFIAALLIVFQLVLLLVLAKTDSQTTDEAVHIYAGYTYVKHGDFRLNPEHPPFVKLLSGLAIASLRPNEPQTNITWNGSDNCSCDVTSNFFYDSWRENRSIGEQFLYSSGNNPSKILFAARLPIVLLTVILGLIIFVAATRWWGYKAGLVALSMYVFNPTVAGHGHLVTTDVGVSLGMVVFALAFWGFLKRPSWKTMIWLGLGFGFVAVTKFTSVIFLPVSLAILLGAMWWKKDWPTSRWRTFGWYLLSLVVAWFVIWATYGFSTRLAPQTGSILQAITQSNSLPSLGAPAQDLITRIYDFLRHILIPRQYFKGVIMVLSHTTAGHGSYLLGQVSSTGWWYYFPVLLLLKNSLSWLVMVGLGLWITFKSRLSRAKAFYWLALAGGFLLFAMQSKADLGVRHVLPVIVALSVWFGAVFNLASAKQRLLILVLVVWSAGVLILSFPYYLSYFNELVGQHRGYLIARDSNLDWGQDIYRIKDYIERNDLNAPYLDYNWDGQNALKTFGLNYQTTEPNYQTTDGINAKSVGILIITPSSLTDPKYDFLKGVKPYDYVTPGVLVFKLPVSK